MATETEQLVVQLEARIRDFERNFEKANRTAQSQFGSIERRGQQSAVRLEAVLGRIGLGASAAIAAGGAAVYHFQKQTKAALDSLGQLKDEAQVAGVSTDVFQAIRFQAAEAGVSTQKFAEAMQKFAVESEAAKEGSGDLYNKLRNVSQSLADDFRRATDQAERFRIVLAATSKLATDSERASFARAAFGRGGVGMVRAISDINEAGGFEKIVANAKAAGAVVDSELIKRAEKLGDELDRSANIIRTSMTSAFASLATSWGFGKAREWAADMAVSARRWLEGTFVPAVERSGDTLDAQIKKAQEWQRSLSKAIMTATDPKDVMRLTGELERARAELDELARARAGQTPEAGPLKLTVTPRNTDIDAKIERDRLRERVAAMGTLATAQDQVRLRELDLVETTRRGTITQGEATRIVREAKFALDQQTVALRERLGVATETERLAVKERELNSLVAQGKLNHEEAAKALAIYKNELREVVKYEGLRGSTLPNLNRLAIEAGDLTAQLDQGFAGALRGIGSEFSLLNKSSDTFAQKLSNIALRMADVVVQSMIMKFFLAPLLKGFGFSGGGPVSTDILGKAEGGLIRGPGTGTSDSIPARLSNGEFVINAKSTARHRPVLEAINSDRVARFANGGLVSSNPIRLPTEWSGAAGGSQTFLSAPTINVEVNANGGKPEQNQDLADRIGKSVHNAAREMVAKEIRTQMKPGGLLY